MICEVNGLPEGGFKDLLCHPFHGSDGVALWVGGNGIRRLADVPGVKRLVTLDDATAALAAWRAGER